MKKQKKNRQACPECNAVVGSPYGPETSRLYCCRVCGKEAMECCMPSGEGVPCIDCEEHGEDT